MAYGAQISGWIFSGSEGYVCWVRITELISEWTGETKTNEEMSSPQPEQ